jgi:hypothetical protein
VTAVVDRVACPRCGAQKGEACDFGATPHGARWRALSDLYERIEAEEVSRHANMNGQSTP